MHAIFWQHTSSEARFKTVPSLETQPSIRKTGTIPRPLPVAAGVLSAERWPPYAGPLETWL